MLLKALHYRGFIVLALLVIAGAGYGLFNALNAEFIPQEDYGVMHININAPVGSNMAYTDRYTKEIDAIVKKIPAVKGFTSQVDMSSAVIRVVMKPWRQRQLSTQQVIAKLNPRLAKIPGVTAFASVPDVVDYGEKGSDLTLNFMTTGSYKELLIPMNKLIQILKQYPGLLNVQSNLKFNSQQYAVTINRDLAATLGVNIQDIADTIHAMMSGIHWTDVQSGSRSYEVLLQMRRQDLKNFNAIKQLYVSGTGVGSTATVTAPAATANMIPLSSLIKLTPQIGQGTLHHFDRMRSGSITASLAPGYTESQVIKFINSKVPGVLNSKTRFSYSGKAAQFIESSGSMTGILVLAFVFIYLVLSAQFGSFIDPLIVLLAVPLSIVGALFSLWLGGGTFNLYSQIGIVTLVGMISKHGILITQFINDLRRQGMAMSDAIIEGAKIRLRPVLMTTSAMVFGTLPLALATGPGSVGRHQIGWVIVGGLLFGTFFSLIVVPIAYSFIGVLKRSGVRSANPLR